VKTFTKEQYLEWLKTRGRPGSWELEDCNAADTLIKNVTLFNAKKWLSEQSQHRGLIDYMMLMLSFHYGSGETDEFLQSINAYPDWMEKDDE
jgi:hypothetical protein